MCVVFDGLTAALAVWPAYLQLKRVSWLPDNGSFVVGKLWVIELEDEDQERLSFSWSILRFAGAGLATLDM